MPACCTTHVVQGHRPANLFFIVSQFFSLGLNGGVNDSWSGDSVMRVKQWETKMTRLKLETEGEDFVFFHLALISHEGFVFHPDGENNAKKVSTTMAWA